MFAKTMQAASFTLAAVCAAMTLHDVALLDSGDSIRFALALGVPATLVCLGLGRVWGGAAFRRPAAG